METIITPRAPPIKYPRRTAARYFGLVSSPLMPGRTQQLQYDMNFMLPCSQNFFEFGQGYFTTYYLRFQYISVQYVIKAQIKLGCAYIKTPCFCGTATDIMSHNLV